MNYKNWLKYGAMTTLIAGGLQVINPVSALAICNGATPDGSIAGGDACDDGNLLPGDGCSLTCDVEPGWTCAIPLDFNNLTNETLTNVCNSQPANWVVDADNLGGTQEANSYPTVGLFGADAKANVTFVVDVTVTGNQDDDFFGFVLGYDPGDFTNPNADFLLLDWKKSANSMKLSRVQGITGTPGCANTNLPNWDLWSKSNSVTLLSTAAASPGASAWSFGQTYRFEITYTDTNISVRINGVQHFNLTAPANTTWPDGQLGFYNFSQPGVNYRIIGPLGPSTCNQPPNQGDRTVWRAQDNSATVYDVQSEFSDPNGDGLNPSSVRVTSAPMGVTTKQPSQGAALGTLEVTPTNPALVTDYAIVYEVCDDVPRPSLCDAATLTVRVNDNPTITKQSNQGAPQQPITVLGATILAATNPGTVDNGLDLTSLAVGTTNNGAFGNSAPSALGGTCDLVLGNVVYNPPANASNGAIDRCFVQVCENIPGPIGQDGTGRACGYGELEFTISGAARDLVVATIDTPNLTTNRQTLQMNGSVDVGVLNQGSQSIAQAFEVVAFLDRDRSGDLSAADTQLGTFTVPAGLGAGASSSSTINISNVAADFAGQPIFAVVDRTGAVSEDDETNNVSSTAQLSCGGQADAQTSFIRYDLSGYPGSITFQARVGNAGSLDLGASTKIGFYDGNPNMGGTLIAEANLSQNLAPGEFADISQAWNMPPAMLAPDSRQIFVVSDSRDATAECRENNTHSLGYPIGVTISSPADASVSNNTTPVIGGQGRANGTVDIVVKDSNGMTVATATDLPVNAAGQWSFQIPSALADGVYTISGQAEDEVGNQGLTATSTFRVDTMAPSLSISSPTNNALTNDNTPTLSGSSDPSAMVTVVIKDSMGATLFTQMLVADAMGLWSVDASMLNDGTYTFEATTTDRSGNSASSTTSFTIDTVPPSLAISTPSPLEIVNMSEVTISGASDANIAVTVEVKDAQGNVVYTGQTNADAQGDWSLTTSMLSNGDYTATATSTDAAGNELTSDVSFTVDTDLPNLTVTSPMTDTCLNMGTFALAGQTDVDVTLVLEVVDSQGIIILQETLIVDAAGMFSEQLSMSLPEGDYIVRLVAIRPNDTRFTRELQVQIDLTAPNLELTSPSEGTVSTDTTPTIEGRTEPGLTVEILIDGQSAGTVQADNNGAFSFTLNDNNALANGEHTISLRSDDGCGNEATSQARKITIDTDAPALTITSPMSGMVYMTERPTFSGTSEAGLTVEVIVDGVKIGEAVAGADGTWSLQAPEALAQGPHKVKAQTQDASGNMASTSEIDFTIQLALPTMLDITSPADGATLMSTSFEVSGTGTPGATVDLYVDDKLVGTTTVGGNGQWTIPLDDVAPGQRSLEARLGETTDKITVTVASPTDTDDTTVILTGSSCSSTSGPSPSAGQTLWVALLGMFWGVRRRRSKR